MKFYTISQNNSGGYFIQNNHVEQFICVEAENARDADELLEKITEPYSEYCDCCGKRWYISVDERDGYDFPTNGYGEDISECDAGAYREYIIIYYANGEKKKYNFKTREFSSLDNWI